MLAREIGYQIKCGVNSEFIKVICDFRTDSFDVSDIDFIGAFKTPFLCLGVVNGGRFFLIKRKFYNFDKSFYCFSAVINVKAAVAVKGFHNDAPARVFAGCFVNLSGFTFDKLREGLALPPYINVSVLDFYFYGFF